MQHYYQFQVILKPSPADSQDLYLGSLAAIGLDPAEHDVRFVEDDWESPTLGAWGLGWEVWMDGMEVTQYTYFQQVGGWSRSRYVEITLGLSALRCTHRVLTRSMKLSGATARWYAMTYGDVFLENEREFSAYNFEVANVALMREKFDEYEAECHACLEKKLPLPAYDCVMKCSHAFNLLDSRGAISATERANYILRVRTVAKLCCEAYLKEVASKEGKSASTEMNEEVA
jgi:glycyl-tRNA synthetase alpha chain